MIMKKILPILFTLLFLLGFSESFGQCYYQDTALIHRTRTKKPYAIAISNTGKIAVTSVRTVVIVDPPAMVVLAPGIG